MKLPDRHRLEELDSYSLAIVDNYVLYPVRSVNVRSVRAQDAKVRKPVSKLRRQMFAALGRSRISPVYGQNSPPRKPRRTCARSSLAWVLIHTLR